MGFTLTTRPIDSAALGRALRDERAGGFASFEGWVRVRNEGRQVTALEYEAYGVLAEKEGNVILEEARKRFVVLDAACVHRVGKLALGELAVWVGVTAEHRGPAFEACRYVIDELKSRVPIWKKEHYFEGTSLWINGASTGIYAGPDFAKKV